jgi:hypothetical protein
VRRLAGYDLNGWRDIAVRNWKQVPGEDEDVGKPNTISGGIGGCVVSIEDQDKRTYVGGLQAVLAPHGRGGVQ